MAVYYSLGLEGDPNKINNLRKVKERQESTEAKLDSALQSLNKVECEGSREESQPVGSLIDIGPIDGVRKLCTIFIIRKCLIL